jgi:hypothetical protein
MKYTINIFRKDPFKYRINHFLDLLPKELSASEFARLLELDYRIRRKDFERDRALRMSESREIPADRIKIYAFMFQVDPDQLNNF